jgi:hypothetical protein
MKRKALAIAVVCALALGVTGLAVAATSAPTTARGCVTSGGVLRLVQNGRCATGQRGINLVGRQFQGVAKAYAHVRASGSIDTTRSWRVTSSNLITTSPGFWCFRGLGFRPGSAEVTLDYNGILNGQIPQGTVKLPPSPGDCGLTSANAEVFTGLVDPGNFTTGTKLGFYIVFY